MKLIKSIFGVKDGYSPVAGEFSAFVQKSIPIIGTKGKTLEDSELVALLMEEGIPEHEAVDIVLFTPTAFTRKLFREIAWPKYYIDYYSDDKQTKRWYKDNPRYLIIAKETDRFYSADFDRELFFNVAGRSSELHVINEALRDGTKIESLIMEPTRIIRYS